MSESTASASDWQALFQSLRPRSRSDWNDRLTHWERPASDEVDDAVVGKVFAPYPYPLELSGRNSALQTGRAIRRGIQSERKADVTALDVGDLRYGTYIELQVGPHRIDVLSMHLKSGCFSHKEDENSAAEHASPRLKTACRKLTEHVPILAEWIDSR